jgi:hypothetical protein
MSAKRRFENPHSPRRREKALDQPERALAKIHLTSTTFGQPSGERRYPGETLLPDTRQRSTQPISETVSPSTCAGVRPHVAIGRARRFCGDSRSDQFEQGSSWTIRTNLPR